MAYEKINWENLPSIKTPLSAENLKRMDNAIAELYEQGGGGGSADLGKSSFKSLKLISQDFNADNDEDATYVFDATGLDYVDDDAAKYEQGNRPRQLIVCYEDTNKTTYQRMIIKGGKDSPEISIANNQITITVDKDWKLDLSSLIDETPDFWNYVILKNNIGRPFGNYEIKNDDKVANLSKDGYAYKDGATASGFGTLALAPFANAAGQGNTVAVRRGAALAGEGNQIFNWASTAVGAYNNVYGGMSFAGGANANILAYNGVNFGQGSGYYNPMKPDGSMKSFEEILADRESITDGTILNINYGQSSFITGQGNIAGGLASALFGRYNTSNTAASSSLIVGEHNFNQAPNSLVLGYSNENHVKSALVLGENVNNTDYLLAVGKKFGVTHEGWVKAPAYVGNGDNLTTTNDTVDVPQKAVTPTFKTFSEDDIGDTSSAKSIRVNTQMSGNYALSAAVAGTNYQNKTTYWHSKYDVVDGNPVPNPVLTDDNPYKIEYFVLDENFIPKDNLVIRYYPRQDRDVVERFPTKVKIYDSSDRFSKTFVLTKADYEQQKDEYGYYYDFILPIPSDNPLVLLSSIYFDILQLPDTSTEYPNGKFACAQGIRFGYCGTTTPLVPAKTDSYYALSEKIKRVNSLNEGAYYTTEQLVGLIKDNSSGGTVPDNVVTTDMANVANGYAALDSNKSIEVEKVFIPSDLAKEYNEEFYGTYLTATKLHTSSSFTIEDYYDQKFVDFLGGGGSIVQFHFREGYTSFKDDNTTHEIKLIECSQGTGDITNWYTDTVLKNKSVVSAVYDNYNNIKTLTAEANKKQNKSTYVMDDFAVTKTVTMNNNTEYLYYGKGEFTELTLDFAPAGSEDYSSYISFQSGETPTVFNVTGSGGSGGTSIVLKGDDCDSSGVFTPQANKGYEIAFKCIGITSDATFHIIGRVGAC